MTIYFCKGDGVHLYPFYSGSHILRNRPKATGLITPAFNFINRIGE